MAIFAVMRTKTVGWGPQSVQALIVSIVLPLVAILGILGILDSQAISGLVGGVIGFGVARVAAKE